MVDRLKKIKNKFLVCFLLIFILFFISLSYSKYSEFMIIPLSICIIGMLSFFICFLIFNKKYKIAKNEEFLQKVRNDTDKKMGV